MPEEHYYKKPKGEDGHSVISVRIRKETLSELEILAKNANCSRNEMINQILRDGVDNIRIIP